MKIDKTTFAQYKIRNSSSWTMLIFGILALLLGLLGIAKPEILLRILGFETVERTARASHDYTLVYIMASCMASFNMGIYYILAALNNLKKFYFWTVPFRGVTFVVFTASVIMGYTPIKFLGVALWELVGGIVTGIALYYEHKRGTV